VSCIDFLLKEKRPTVDSVSIFVTRVIPCYLTASTSESHTYCFLKPLANWYKQLYKGVLLPLANMIIFVLLQQSVTTLC